MTTTGLVTIAAAAEYLDVSQRTVRRLVARGELVARRIGPRLVRVELASLEAVGRPLSIPRD